MHYFVVCGVRRITVLKDMKGPCSRLSVNFKLDFGAEWNDDEKWMRKEEVI